MPTGLDSRLHGNDGFQDYGVLGMTVRVFLTIRVFLTGWILKVLRRCRVRKGGCIERAVGQTAGGFSPPNPLNPTDSYNSIKYRQTDAVIPTKVGI